MSQEPPPPIPPPAPSGFQQPTVPPPVNMKVRWILWVLASTIAPALPWLSYSGGRHDDGTGVFVLTALALILQLAASIAVAIGFSRRRFLGAGGAIGMSIVFMLASVAIGTAVWFAVCVGRLSMDFK